MVLPTLILLSFLPRLVLSAANDWTTPCFDGECSYETDLAVVKISGTPEAISDITKAGGWTILECNSTVIEQDIKLVCHSEECEHLNQNNGPENTVVRLPESCGQGPFARVVSSWPSPDQTLPPDLAANLRRRDGTVPEVTCLRLDANFSAIDPAVAGDITFSFQGANVPGAAANFTLTPDSVRRSHIARGLSTNVVAPHSFISIDKSKTLKPIDFEKKFPLFDKSIDCPIPDGSFKASINADLMTKAHAEVTVGLVAKGSLLRFKLDEFGVFVGLDADLGATLELVGNAAATLDTGKVDLLTIPIGGFSIAGFIDVGPSFKVQGQASATLDINASAKVGLSYKVTNAQLVFPKQKSAPTGFVPADNVLELSVSPSAESKAVITAHLIPTINLGVNAFGAGANIFLDLDASSTATLTLNAQAQAEVSTGNKTAPSASVDGCVDVSTGIDVNAGADASFFGLLDKSKTFNLFSKKFDVFKKCFQQPTFVKSVKPPPKARRSIVLDTRVMEKRDLTCPPANVAGIEGLFSLIGETVTAANIKPLRRSIGDVGRSLLGVYL